MLPLHQLSMKHLPCLLLLVLVAGCASTRIGLAPVAVDLAITRVSVVDVEGGLVVSDQTVLLADNRIRAVGPIARVRIPPGVPTVDARHKYLIPGLWDMHVHLGPPSVATVYSLPLLIANGITGVREMGAPLDSILDLRQRISTDSVLSPQIVAAGSAIAGSPPWGGPPGDLFRVETPAEGRAAVDSLYRSGADFIKVHDFLPRDVYLAIAAEAKRLHMPLAGHLRATVGPGEASQVGQVSIEHLAPEFAAYCAPEGEARARAFYSAWREGFAVAYMRGMLELWRTREPGICEEMWTSLRNNGTWVVPTLVLRMQDSTIYSRPAASYLRPAMRELCDATIEHWGISDPALTKSFYQNLRQQVADMHRAGVPLLAGSDAGSACLVPGFSLHDELGRLAEAGLSPLEALRTATLNPARFLAATDSLGSIAPGKLANLVLLNGSPLEDIRNVQKISAVVLNGRYLDRHRLDEMLMRAEQKAHR